jgi:hypothetical protein
MDPTTIWAGRVSHTVVIVSAIPAVIFNGTVHTSPGPALGAQAARVLGCFALLGTLLGLIERQLSSAAPVRATLRTRRGGAVPRLPVQLVDESSAFV